MATDVPGGAPAPPKACDEVFGTGLELPYLILLDEVHDALEASVSSMAFLTFLRLLRYAKKRAFTRESVDGWVRVVVEKGQLERDLSRNSVSLSKYFNELSAVGAIRREQRGSETWYTCIRHLPLLAVELLSRPEVREVVEKRFVVPEDKVQYGTESLPSWTDVRSGRVSDAEEEDYVAWASTNRDLTRALLSKTSKVRQTITESKQQTGASLEKQKTKVKKPAPTRPRKEKKDTSGNPIEMVRHYRASVEIGLALRPEAESRKLVGQMRTLLARWGVEVTKEMIDFLTSPEGWGKTQAKVWQIRDEVVPTLGRILQVDAQVVNLMQGRGTEKRSGGAAVARTIEADDLSF